MARVSLETIGSVTAILALSAWYGVLARSGAPSPGSRIGLTLGISGFLLMLAAETLYTLRKRSRRFHWGAMNTWLQIHVFTGLVGPWLVLLHSGGRFYGLAAVVSLLTVIMVVSGFVGRFIYTATPRTVQGAEMSAEEMEYRLGEIDQQLRTFPPALRNRAAQSQPAHGWRLIFGRHWLLRRYRNRIRSEYRAEMKKDPGRTFELEQLLIERFRLGLQARSLMTARRFLAIWHLFHVPLGAVLFILAFIHIIGALYYSTFSR